MQIYSIYLLSETIETQENGDESPDISLPSETIQTHKNGDEKLGIFNIPAFLPRPRSGFRGRRQGFLQRVVSGCRRSMLTFTLVQPAVKGVWAQGNTNTGFDGKLSPVGPRSGHKTVTAAQCNFFLRPLSPTFHWLPSSLFPLHIARVGPGFRYYIHPSQVSGIMRNYSNGLCL